MTYGDAQILDDVSFTVASGEIVALLGPNGAGKSTTIEVLEGFRRASRGSVSVLGRDPQAADDAWRARLGIVLQTWSDHGKWRVRDLLMHMRRLYAPAASQPVWNVDDLMEATGLTSSARNKLSSLSGGQRRRVDIALAVLCRPALLLMDEPTAGFDPESRRSFQRLISAFTEDDTATLITTHDLDEAERIADRIIILVGGRIVAVGTVEELARQTGAGDEVLWEADGVSHSEFMSDSTGFVRDLMVQSGDQVSNLRVRRRSLEDVYLAIVAGAEATTESVIHKHLPAESVKFEAGDGANEVGKFCKTSAI
ncbi:multidrug ABC transporter ATP-binding protein, partial [Rathayibacter tritici]